MSIVTLLIVIALGVAALVANNRYNAEPISKAVINVIVVCVFVYLLLSVAGLIGARL